MIGIKYPILEIGQNAQIPSKAFGVFRYHVQSFFYTKVSTEKREYETGFEGLFIICHGMWLW